MTLGELRKRWKNLPDETRVLVWDFGEGGFVEANSTESDEDSKGNPTCCVMYNRPDSKESA